MSLGFGQRTSVQDEQNDKVGLKKRFSGSDNARKPIPAFSAFARVLGMNQKTVDLYVKGERKPSVDFVRSICSNFHVSADWLLGLSDEQPPSGQVSAANSSVGAIAIGGGNAVNRDCMECPLLKDHLKRFSRAK